MSDTTTFSRSTMTYGASVSGQTVSVRIGEVRASTDPVVLQAPSYWQALSDTDLSSGKKLLHF